MKRFFQLPIDWVLLAIPVLLTVVGIVTIYTITLNHHQASLAVDQGVFFGLGLVALVVCMFSDYRWLNQGSRLLYLFGILLLVPLLPFLAPKLPFVLKIFGAYRWLNFGFFQLQPAEVFKLIAAVSSAAFLAPVIGNLRWKKLAAFLVLAGLPVGLVLVQPDLGTTSVVFVVFLGVFLAAQPSRKTLIGAALLLMVGIIALWLSLQPYQRNRVETFLNPNLDPQGEGYNVRQALIAVGSGGLTGRGFGQGSQTVLNFLPVAHADFIFAGYAEATGFVGSAALVILYLIMLQRIITIAQISTDPFGRLLAVGIGAKMFFQTTVHIGMNLGILPVTGIPLPFMSYGGTSLIIDFATIGVLQSIYIRHKKTLFVR
jgi:rod shape determining protein RodA